MKRTVLGAVIVAIIVLTFAPLFVSCKQASDSTGSEGATSDNVLWRSELFDYAVEALLNQTGEFYSTERQQQMINRLDQWVRLQKPLEGWKPDPLIAGVNEELTVGSEKLLNLAQRISKIQRGEDAGELKDLPGEFRSSAKQLGMAGSRLALIEVLQLASQMSTMADQLQQIVDKTAATPGQTTEAMRAAFSQFNLEQFALLGAQLQLLSQRIDPSILEFPVRDGPFFQEAVWLRDVSTWAKGDELDDPVKPAVALFDWVVKNVDLVRDSLPQGQQGAVRVLHTPMETLLFGKGTGIDRAWLFVLLARQMNIDAALLGLADENNNLTRLWGVGVLIDAKIYLFEPVLGVPIPKPGSLQLTESGLALEPATLTEAAENEAVFEQLDVVKKGSYAVRAKDMQRVVALVEASPGYLSQRMEMVENRLTGNQKIVLTTDPTAQIERFKECRYVVGGQMWPLPYQTIWQEIRLGAERQQWLAKRLRPFIFPPQMALLWQARSYHFKGQFTGKPSATMFYQAARRSDFSMDSASISEQDKGLWQEIKIDASYWLGLLVAQEGNYRSAEDYLRTRVLVADPGGKWEQGATYNLARVAEATDDVAMATKLYRLHLTGPQAQGNLIRARWLMELSGQNDLTPKEGEPETAEDSKKSEAKVDEPKSDDKKASQQTKESKPENDMPEKAGDKLDEQSQEPKPEKPAPEKADKKSDDESQKPKAETEKPKKAAAKTNEESPAPKEEKATADSQ